MITKNLFVLSALSLSLSLAALSPVSGCGRATTAAETTAEKPNDKPAMPDKIISEADKNKPVALGVGQRLLVRLKSNPTTGYEWSVAQTDAKLLAPDGETTFDVPDSDRAGAPTVQTLFFKAKSAGQVELVLHYARPWEKDKAPLESYKVSIDIVNTPKK